MQESANEYGARRGSKQDLFNPMKGTTPNFPFFGKMFRFSEFSMNKLRQVIENA